VFGLGNDACSNFIIDFLRVWNNWQRVHSQCKLVTNHFRAFAGMLHDVIGIAWDSLMKGVLLQGSGQYPCTSLCLDATREGPPPPSLSLESAHLCHHRQPDNTIKGGCWPAMPSLYKCDGEDIALVSGSGPLSSSMVAEVYPRQ
jgi:hypothetical protein